MLLTLREPLLGGDARPAAERAVKRDLGVLTSRQWAEAVAAVSHTGLADESRAVISPQHEVERAKTLMLAVDKARAAAALDAGGEGKRASGALE